MFFFTLYHDVCVVCLCCSIVFYYLLVFSSLMLRWVFVKSSFSCVACWEKRLKHDRNRTDVHLCLIQLGHGPVLSNQYLIKYWNLHSLVAQGQGERRFDYGRVSIAALNKPHGGLGGIWLMFRDSTVLAQAIILKSGPEPLEKEIDEI